jgi:hypothetical protein
VFYAPRDLPWDLYKRLLETSVGEVPAGQLGPLLLPANPAPAPDSPVPQLQPKVAGAWLDVGLGWAAESPSSGKDTGLLRLLQWVKDLQWVKERLDAVGAPPPWESVWSEARQERLIVHLKQRLAQLAQDEGAGLEAPGLLGFVPPGRVIDLPPLPERVRPKLLKNWQDGAYNGILMPAGKDGRLGFRGTDTPDATWRGTVRDMLWDWATDKELWREYQPEQATALFAFLRKLADAPRDMATNGPRFPACAIPWLGPTEVPGAQQTVHWVSLQDLQGGRVPKLFAVEKFPQPAGGEHGLEAAIFKAFKAGTVGLTLSSAAKLSGLPTGGALVDQVLDWMASDQCGEFAEEQTARRALLEALLRAHPVTSF